MEEVVVKVAKNAARRERAGVCPMFATCVRVAMHQPAGPLDLPLLVPKLALRRHEILADRDQERNNIHVGVFVRK